MPGGFCVASLAPERAERLRLLFCSNPNSDVAPRRRSQPTCSHLSSSSRSVGPASINKPAAMRSSPPPYAAEPSTGNHPDAFGADVIASLRNLSEMINQRLQLGPLGGEQRFAVQLRGKDLIFGGHAPSLVSRADNKVLSGLCAASPWSARLIEPTGRWRTAKYDARSTGRSSSNHVFRRAVDLSQLDDAQ
jgi:hypothetical protein